MNKAFLTFGLLLTFTHAYGVEIDICKKLLGEKTAATYGEGALVFLGGRVFNSSRSSAHTMMLMNGSRKKAISKFQELMTETTYTAEIHSSGVIRITQDKVFNFEDARAKEIHVALTASGEEVLIESSRPGSVGLDRSTVSINALKAYTISPVPNRPGFFIVGNTDGTVDLISFNDGGLRLQLNIDEELGYDFDLSRVSSQLTYDLEPNDRNLIPFERTFLQDQQGSLTTRVRLNSTREYSYNISPPVLNSNSVVSVVVSLSGEIFLMRNNGETQRLSPSSPVFSLTRN